MSLNITGKPTDFCPPLCPCMRLSVQYDVKENPDACLTPTKVTCIYESVCRMWHDREVEKAKTPNDLRKEMGLKPIKQAPRTAKWKVWSGWSGNHDARIENATCSRCGYVHQTVYGSLSQLANTCPHCHSKMTVKEV